MEDKRKKTSLRVDPELLAKLHEKYPYFNNDSEAIRYAILHLLMKQV